MKENVSRFPYEIEILSPSILTNIRPGVLMQVVLDERVAATEFKGEWPYLLPDTSLPLESRRSVMHFGDSGSYELEDFTVVDFIVKVDLVTDTLLELYPIAEIWPEAVASTTRDAGPTLIPCW